MAFCGLVSALSIALMLSGGIIPIATYCVPIGVSIFLLPVCMEFGAKTAWITYLSTALICVLLGIDKEAAFFYVFLGYYPIVKWHFDRVKRIQLRYVVKIAFFSSAIIVMYLILGYLMNMGALLAEFKQMGVWLSALFLVFFDVCMLLFDRLLLPLAILYVNRLRPRLTFLK